MLTSLTRKLCPFVMMIATIGCGKKIQENSSSPTQAIENQELPSALIIKLNGYESSRKIYRIPRNGHFFVPSKLRVREGNVSGKRVSLTYNLRAINDETDFEFRCFYGTSIQSAELPLDFCEDAMGRNLGTVTTQKFMMDIDKYIRMQLVDGSASGLIIEAIYSVDWK